MNLTLKQFKQFLKTLIRTKYLKSKEDIKKFIVDIWLLHINTVENKFIRSI